MFGATNVLKNSNKDKWVYGGYRIAFNRKVWWSFGSDFAKNVAIFGVDNSSPSTSDNQKNNFLILGKGPNSDINGSFGSPEKEFSKSNTKFCL